MSSPEPCDFCGSFTDLRRLITVSELDYGIQSQCPGCQLLADALDCWPMLQSQVAYMLWSHERTLSIRLFDADKKSIEKGLELYTAPGEPCIFRMIGPGRSVSSESWDSNTAHLTKSWLRDCGRHHTRCFRSFATPLPNRVIEVGRNDDEVSLYITANEYRSYTALSHCWGSGQKPIQTTNSTLKQYMSKITFDEQSRTFADAVRVTRDLGFKYLWIDSLCIVQDDKEDWAIEASKMSQVYRNSAITISAEGARSASDGLFAAPAVRQSLQLEHRLKCITDWDTETTVYARLRESANLKSRVISHSSVARPDTELSTRAWVVQERLLSPRTLHFFEEELAWSCQSLSRCECKCDAGPTEPSVFTNLNDSAAAKLKIEYELQREWAGLVTSFSQKKLTYPSDRLPAISGLAGLVQKYTQSQYYAGLWSFDLAHGLLWQSDHEGAGSSKIVRFTDDAAIPTWSWASVIGPIMYIERHRTQFEHRSRKNEVKPLLQVIDTQIEAAGPNEFGGVKSGTVTVNGKLLRVGYDKDRKVWRPRKKADRKLPPAYIEVNSPEDVTRILEQLSLVTYPEPDFEPDVRFDIIDEDPAITNDQHLQKAEYYFLRAGVYIFGGLFSSEARESLCLLLRRVKTSPESTQGQQMFKRAGIVFSGFHSVVVWKEQPMQQVTIM